MSLKSLIARGSVLLALCAVVAACRKPREPHIEYIFGDTVVTALDSATYDCNAWDWNSKRITYAWSASRGELAWGFGFRVRWYAPESSGPAQVSCVVTNADGFVNSETLVLRVKSLKKTIMDFNGAVKAGEFREWRDSLRAGYRLEGRFAVDTPRVSFLVLDSANYLQWRGDQAYEPLVARFGVKSDSFDTVVPAGLRYYFILDNRNEDTDKGFHLFVRKTTP